MPPKDLFNGYLDGDLSAEQLLTLEDWIAADANNAATFLEWMALQTWTREALQGELLQQVLQETDPVNRLPAPTGVRTARWGWFAVLAASLLIAAMAYSLGTPSRDGVQVAEQSTATPEQAILDAIDESAPEEVDASIVATLTHLDKCKWADNALPLDYGQQLEAGTQIKLNSGVVRVTFESGAEAVLQGPCDFVVDSAMHGTIRSGGVAVTAPKRAYGFRIRSPNAEVIDLGTVFGVNVDASGDSEVHVFSGEVLSRSVDQHDGHEGELTRLTANHALKYNSDAAEPSKIASNGALFARTEPVSVRKADYDFLPDRSGLALWLAADLSARRQDGDGVVAWSDILFGDNVTAEDAFQPQRAAQPKLVANGINGKPALSFNGTNEFLVTTPLETTDNQTIVMVCQFSEAAERPGRKRGGQILNYNGPPHRLVSSTYEPGVLQIGEPLDFGFKPTSLGGKLFAGRLDGKDVSEAEMYSPPIGVGVPVVLVYRYDLDKHLASLWINGELIDQKPALRPAGVTSRKTIGRHGFMKFFFAGDLGELMIFNSALEGDALRDVTGYLSNKYKIELKPQPAA
ncbi:hypothetical protein [Lacipirellula parvula]|uniref:FecR protein domain-containing protein n=1 Tax=Lacipirellula parvula TaxID=2650471 RepID=A0A5K7XQ43_9BACT|nr:hypothetical protein [Lacipirellula parvula]BBO35649.1 hypothetical protein PLANPX_5261 [Lacipirellula parvula]